jgi:hypothetical protein
MHIFFLASRGSFFLIPDILQKPTRGNLLSQAAPLGFPHHVTRRRSELQALGAAVGEKSDLVFVGAAFELSGNNVREHWEILRKDIDGRIGDALDLL